MTLTLPAARGEVLGLAAAAVRHLETSQSLLSRKVRVATTLKNIGGDDDVFQNSQRLSLPTPSYTARLDVLFQESGEVNESLVSLPAEQPLSIQLRVHVRSLAADSGWLLLTALREDWSVDRQSVTNTNLEEWPGGPLPVVPAFDPRSTLVATSSGERSALMRVAFLMTPVRDVTAGSFLRVQAPTGFVWAADCVEGSGPGGLVQPGQCWRDSSEPSVALLELMNAMQAQASYELFMQILSPAALRAPNRWELATLSLAGGGGVAQGTSTSTAPPGLVASPPAVNVSAEVVSDPRELHTSVVPQQVIRLTGFQLSGLEARLQPLQWFPEAEKGQLLLLSFRLALHLEELRLATLPLQLRLTAPQGVTVSCPSGEALGGQAHGGPSEAVQYTNVSTPQTWRLLATQQRLALLSRCTPQDSSGDSSVLLELQAPPSSASEAPGEWLALPVFSSTTEKETFASVQTWALRLGDSLAEVQTLHTSPRMLRPSARRGGSLAEALACTSFCAAVAGDHQELPAAAALAVDRGNGIRLQLALSLPKAPPTRSSRLIASRIASPFRQGVRSSDFADAAVATLVDFVRITAPAPLRWLDNCRVQNTSMLSSALWRCLCYGNEAYVYTLGYTSTPALPLREVIEIQGVTLLDPAEPETSVRLPFSSTWIASLFEDGALVDQLLLESHADEGILHLATVQQHEEENQTSPGNTTGSSVGDSTDTPEDTVDLEQCTEQEMSYYPCPVGMVANGLRVVRLGGAGSWMDSLQLLCSQELDVGTNHTQWLTQAGSTGLAGNRQLLSFTDSGGDAEVEVLRCDARASSLLVGVRLVLWRQRKVAGFAAACAAWAQVERVIPWDAETHEELQPQVASADLETGANCTGLVPIEGSERWASCQGMANLKPCPDPEMCCCDKDFQYIEALGSCEPCTAEAALERPRRLCPPGTAVIGFYAGVAASEGSGHQAVGSDLLISTICSIRLRCGPLQVRQWAGHPSTTGSLVVAGWDPPVEQAGDLELPGLANLGFELQWWHYVAAGAALLFLLCCVYRYCRTSQATVYGDVQTGGKSSWSNLKSVVKLPSQVVWRYILRPIGSLVLRMLEPIWTRALRPVLRWIGGTRAARLLAGFGRRLWRLLKCCCPCLRRLEKVSFKETLKAARDPMAASKSTRARVARQWELRRQLMSGTLDAQKAKDDLLGQLKRGEIDEKELGIRQREIDDLVAKSQAMMSKASLKDRVKSMRSQSSFRPLSATKSFNVSKTFSATMSFARSGSMHSAREDGGRCCACCRRLPKEESKEEQVQGAAEAAAQDPDESKGSKWRPEDDEEWEYFWEEDSEEEDFEDDQMVDVSPARTRGQSESLGFGPVASRTSRTSRGSASEMVDVSPARTRGQSESLGFGPVASRTSRTSRGSASEGKRPTSPTITE
ncbi:unnamed protein product [Symbiodinium natans]|uniref:Uncharacterized protein n=1 Tax=Symbiodinium natans TaxID=878477 RepID=A0A812JTQ3_9DINO|nr:unnamed protein product [Symbiodinium natans]